MWIKYNTKWAWGVTEPRFVEVSSIRWFRDQIIPSINDRHAFSDKYRGIEYCKVSKPPKKILCRAIQKERDVIVSSTRRCKRLETLFSKTYKGDPYEEIQQ